MKELIQQYIEEKKAGWPETTVSVERYRLNALADVLTGDPSKLWEHLKTKQAAYTRVTTWARVVKFWDWLIKMGHYQGANPYRVFREEFPNLFKNTYVRRVPDITFEEAERRISRINDPAVQRRAREILYSGIRYFERDKVQGDGIVEGKGGKRRQVYIPQVEGPQYDRGYHTFRRHLAMVGLKPHDLRKLCLNRLIELGANQFELLAAAGWSSMNTAQSYIEAKQSKVRELYNKMRTADKK